MAENSHNLISIILSQDSYPDRFKMLFQLGEHVDRHVILTREAADRPQWATNTEVRTPPTRRTGLAYWWWAARTARAVMAGGGSEAEWTVHEHVIGISTLMMKLLPEAELPSWRSVVSVYAAEVTFLKERRWKVDPYGAPMSVGQQGRYVGKFLKKLGQHWLSWFHPDALTGNSQMVIDDIHQCFPDQRCEIVPTAVDLEFFDADHAEEADAMWDSGALRILHVGQIAGFKGFGTLMRSFGELLDAGRDAQMLLLGGQFDFDSDWIEEVIDTYGVRDRLVRPGRIPRQKLVGLYKSADFLVCPSFHEGSPRVVKEALAAGCPVLASDIPGTRMLDPPGDTIQFFPPGDARRLLELMTTLADDPELRRRLARRGVELAKNYSPGAIAREVRALYDRL